MTCKNCLFYPMCVARKAKMICQNFKNKADFAEVKHGHWDVKEFPNEYKKFIMCSECQRVIDSKLTLINEYEFDFCPYCGAKMDEKD